MNGRPAPPAWNVQPQQGVLWSVGPDRADSHGRVQAGAGQQGGDLVFLVPMPPKKAPGP
jgi:hypothetical protein